VNGNRLSRIIVAKLAWDRVPELLWHASWCHRIPRLPQGHFEQHAGEVLPCGKDMLQRASKPHCAEGMAT
jgi:hypothetical protein